MHVSKIIRSGQENSRSRFASDSGVDVGRDVDTGGSGGIHHTSLCVFYCNSLLVVRIHTALFNCFVCLFVWLICLFMLLQYSIVCFCFFLLIIMY